MEKVIKSHQRKKFRSPLGGKRPHKTSILPKFGVNLKDPEVPGMKTKNGKKRPKLQFQMGGDCTDPLNLNSLIDRDPTDVTPQCSPYVDRVKELSPQVVIPRDVTDPLNLKCDLYQDLKGIVVVTPAKRKRKRKRNDSACYDDEEENKSRKETEENKDDLVLPKMKKKKMQKQKDTKEIKMKEKKSVKETEKRQLGKESGDLFETIKTDKCLKVKTSKNLVENAEKLVRDDQAGSQKTSLKETHKDVACLSKESPSKSKAQKISTQKFKSDQKKHQKTFLYGNYNRYYGYRSPKVPDDPRLKLFQCEWFKDKNVLDVGCNIGNVTLEVARNFSPKHILGIDIDSSLIRAANKYLRCAIQEDVRKKPTLSGFPMSFMVCRGPIISRTSPTEGRTDFPYNVQFKEENFVPQSVKALAKQKPTYDVILCLSLTKWIHLNWGDEGLKRTFQRMFLMLNPGGRLLLEAQPFNSYARRKNLSEKIRRNYDLIEFKPNQFVDYLMSEEVGFAAYEALGVAENMSKGFQRPVYVFTKSVSGESYDALGVNIVESRKTSCLGTNYNDY